MTICVETKTLSSLELFYEEVLRDYTLQEQLKAATSPENLIELAVKLGAERGYNFTISEVKSCLEGNQEVTSLAVGSGFQAKQSCSTCGHGY